MIDWDRLAELRADVGEEDFDMVVEIFFEETDPVVERLAAGVDPETAEADFHFLKGSAANFGFAAFADICGRFETAAGRGDVAADHGTTAASVYAQSKSEFFEGPMKQSA